jgi:hypothetical protein
MGNMSPEAGGGEISRPAAKPPGAGNALMDVSGKFALEVKIQVQF